MQSLCLLVKLALISPSDKTVYIHLTPG